MLRARSFSAWIDRIAGPLSPRRLAGMRWLFVDTLLSQASASFSEDFVAVFALALGATADRIGALLGVANLFGMIAYLPGAVVSGRSRTRKPFVMATGGGLARVAILGLALVPVVARQPAAALALVLVLRSVTVFMNSAATPAATALMADLVPAAARGRFFAGRNAAAGVVAIVVSPIAGFVAASLNARAGDGGRGYQAAFVVSCVLGLLATLSYARIPEPPSRRDPRQAGGLRRVPGLLARDPGFSWFAASGLLWSLALNVATPFYNLFLVQELRGTAADIGVNTGITSAATLVGLLVFGALADRRGNRRLFVVLGLLVPLSPMLWMFVHRPQHLYPVYIVSGFLWSGYNLAAFNLLLESAPAGDRESAVALYSTVVAAGAVAGPFLGGMLIPALGYRLTFLVSGAGRLAASLLYIAGTAGNARRADAGRAPGAP